jgi:hypothetical protein
MNIDNVSDFISTLDKDIDRLSHINTTDLGLASCLLSLGFPVSKLDKSDPRRCSFIFEKCPRLEKAIDNYWYGSLKINAKSLFDNQRFLKNRIYSNE